MKQMKIARGTTRAKRRDNQNYAPVNPVASVRQHPEGRFSKSLTESKRIRLAAGITTEE